MAIPPTKVPDPGTAYRVFIERALNHAIVEIGAGTGNIGIADPYDAILYRMNGLTFVNERIASIRELAKGSSNAKTELQRNNLPKKNPAAAKYPGLSTATTGNEAVRFANIAMAMAKLDNSLDETVEVLYLGMRAFLGAVEHEVADKAARRAFLDGWDAGLNRQYFAPGDPATPPAFVPQSVPDAARDAAVVPYVSKFDVHALRPSPTPTRPQPSGGLREGCSKVVVTLESSCRFLHQHAL